MSEISTRRALEVVLSRVPMDRGTANILAYALRNEVARPNAPDGNRDPDALRATIKGVSADLRELLPRDFPRHALQGRLRDAADTLERSLWERST